jgi:carbamate kinase
MSPGPIVAALGGNALLRRGQPIDIATQRRNVASAVSALAPLAERGPLLITHGNGPQVGLLAAAEPFPLDVLDAETEGMIGYLLAQALRNALPGREVAALLTQVVVDPDDEAFRHPVKPIGPAAGVRRLVASPEPRAIVELSTIRLLLEAGTIVICLGGGGIPVTREGDGSLRGVEAVVDKDLASAQLAIALDAVALLLLTDVPAVEHGWDTDTPRPIRRASPRALRAGGFAAGSMGPKAEAAARFTERTGRAAAIGALDEAALLLDGVHGTTIANGAR